MVSAGIGSTTSGTLTPLRSDSGPPVTTSHLQVVVALASHAQAQLAVVQQQGGADAGGGHDLGVRQLHPARVAGHGGEIQPERLPGLQRHPPRLEAAHAQLGPLHVGQDADRAADLFLQRADDRDAGGVILVRAMAEVQAEHVRAAAEQPAEHLGRAAGRADGGNDLRAPAAAQFAWGHAVGGSGGLRDQDGAEIVHVGERGAGAQQVADGVEQGVAVMRAQAGGRVAARQQGRGPASSG